MSLRFVVRVADTQLAERVIAEVWAAGSAGIEDEGSTLIVYAPEADAARVRAAAERALGTLGELGPMERVDEVDWSVEWKRGLKALVISDRLVVRPSFVAHEPCPGQFELLIEVGQAFGTGGHASTQLALEWVDELFATRADGTGHVIGPAGFSLPGNARVLDVGTGSGVLALAALGLGAGSAVGVDTDAVAVIEAADAARRNGLADRAHFVVGSLDALREPRPGFDLLLANLLSSEVTPILPEIARALRPGGLAVFSGLLASERGRFEDSLCTVGLEILAWRDQPDESRPAGQPPDDWVSPLASRTSE